MAEACILNAIKSALGITGTFLDNTINIYIDEVVAYMISAGVSEKKAKSTSSAGVIAKGVSDLWNYGSGQGKLSDYFYQRVTQLAYEEDKINE